MLRIVPHTVPRVGRSYEHFPDGFELHLLQLHHSAFGVWGLVFLGFGVRGKGWGFASTLVSTAE